MELEVEQFEETKKIQLEILLEFNRVCQKNNIHNNLYFGTMLGAVRHKGFIPWDDDIDVAMTRENYDKFLSLYSKNLKEDYFVQNYETDPSFFRPFTRIRKNGTIYKQFSYRDLDIHHGIFIDVFPFDSVYSNKKKEIIRYQYLNRLQHLNYIKHLSMAPDANIVKKGIQRVVDRAIPTLKFNRYITKVLTKRNNQNTGYLNHMTNNTPLYKYDKTVIKEEDFLNSVLWEFEGHKLPILKDYDKYLTQNYGNYMKLPPVDEQKPHHGIVEIKL